MNASSIITSILPYLYALVALAAIYALVQIGRLVGKVSHEMEELTARVNPILEKADVSVDALNADLLRVDGILSNVEEISSAAASATRAVESVTSAPLEIATNLADRLRHMIKEFRSGASREHREDVPPESEYLEVASTPEASSDYFAAPEIQPSDIDLS